MIFPELHQAITKHSDYAYELLKQFPSPEKMVTAGFDKLIEIKRLTAKHALDILKLAPDSIGTTSFACEVELVEIIENIQHYENSSNKSKRKLMS